MLSLIAALNLAAQENVPPPQVEIEKAIKAGTEALLRNAGATSRGASSASIPAWASTTAP
jgi:hypothetical protein